MRLLGRLARLDLPLPTPPQILRRGPFREGAFASRLRSVRTTVRIGRWLGLAVAVCFGTGLLSHYAQHPVAWLPLPARPVWGYRLTQGLHVATGTAAVPLLLAKLWSVYPRLWAWPPARSARHAVERLSIAVLVASVIFQLGTGLVNLTGWYPWGFSFPTTHYAMAWVTVGALLVHLAVKAPLIAASWRASPTSAHAEPEPADDGPGLSRRGLLAAAGTAVGAVTVATVGQTVRPLDRLSVLAPRSPSRGPQGLPVTRTAAAAQVRDVARDPAYRLAVDGPGASRPLVLSLADLEALPRVESRLPITCVEGWSAGARWRGVRLGELLDRVGARPDARVRVVSMEAGGPYASSLLDPPQARDPLTLLALDLNGERLDLDHGYPARLIAPDRPGVLQTKWVTRLEVLA